MRKQIARLVLSISVLPISFFIINLSSHSVKTPRLTAWAGSHVLASPASPHRSPTLKTTHFKVFLASQRGAKAKGSAQYLTNPATTWTSSVGAVLTQASSQVLVKGHQIEAQYQAQLAAQRRVQPQESTYQARTYSEPQISGSMQSALACIRQYESGNNYADSSNPYYRGAYQFSWSTWASVGGTGDPAGASPAEQDMRAEMLVAKDGWGAWSTASLCGV